MDTTPGQRALVGWRLLGVATTVLALGSGAHVLGGGAAPSLPVAALVGALVLLGAAGLARRPLTVRVLLPAALLGQLGVHAALTWLAHGVVPGPGVLDPVAGDHTGLLAGAPAAPAVLDATASAHGHALVVGPMLAAHAAAMVATVLVLVATERGVLALAHRWAGLLPTLLGAAPLLVTTRPAPAPVAVPLLRRAALHRDGTTRRGPPTPRFPHAAAA